MAYNLITAQRQIQDLKQQFKDLRDDFESLSAHFGYYYYPEGKKAFCIIRSLRLEPKTKRAVADLVVLDPVISGDCESLNARKIVAADESKERCWEPIVSPREIARGLLALRAPKGNPDDSASTETAGSGAEQDEARQPEAAVADQPSDEAVD